MIVGLVAGFMSGAVGFGGGMILLPVITSVYGIEVAVPVSTIAQLISNLSKVGMGFRSIDKKFYQKIVAGVMIATSVGLFFSV